MKSPGQIFGAVLALLVAVPTTAWSQERVGVATTVLGPVTIARASAPAEPLKFKDDILLNDRIVTGEQGFTRLLLGGKALVTAREHSVLVIKEVPGTSTIDLASGRISVAVDKAKMRPGDLVEIKTPNAVAGIRGTIVVAEVRGNTSTISVLRGLVDVYRLDAATGRSLGPATTVGAREAVTVRGDVLPPRPQTLSTDQAGRLSGQFKPPVQAVSSLKTLPPSEETGRARSAVAALTSVTPTQVDSRREIQGDRGNGNGNNGGAASPKFQLNQPLPTADTNIRQITNTNSSNTTYISPFTKDKLDKLRN